MLSVLQQIGKAPPIPVLDQIKQAESPTGNVAGETTNIHSLFKTKNLQELVPPKEIVPAIPEREEVPVVPVKVAIPTVQFVQPLSVLEQLKASQDKQQEAETETVQVSAAPITSLFGGQLRL